MFWPSVPTPFHARLKRRLWLPLREAAKVYVYELPGNLLIVMLMSVKGAVLRCMPYVSQYSEDCEYFQKRLVRCGVHTFVYLVRERVDRNVCKENGFQMYAFAYLSVDVKGRL